MSTIKGTLRHNRKGGGGGVGRDSDGGKNREFKGSNYSFNSPARKRKNKTKEKSQGGGICSISLRSFKISLSLQRNICQKHAHIRYHSLPQNPPHLTILKGNAQAKPLGLEFQILQVLCKSTKSVRIGARILVTDSFSWNSFTYMYMY